ncbi:hypothetical protein HYH03_008343 [Edaphochlamys debaryana]|uniref:RmlD-like substrate binding domain-containing protein n=1 Tax=Edaphochlamys debaryana TaxID=47281 RepID=A0A835Y1F5_9CHLO|nr:hypothetical protein HYH03_008343 [Edaphochlamys debaryana]|eukprot:KAG2493529.1 hypothetical protein HYH03_008343 [Edaphochlamys debaryana]
MLITGGSGYLGQFLVHGFAPSHEVHYTFATRKLEKAPAGTVAHEVDLVTGEGLKPVFEQAEFDVVVNCAALSQPGLCESLPERARAINVPSHLLDCLEAQAAATGRAPVLVHISTDQVYDGSRAQWAERDVCAPVNAYGKTKLEAEEHILSRLPAPYPVAILRSSIIYGPPPPEPVPRALFLQFVASAVRGDAPTSFYEDEWRSPVFVEDLRALIAAAAERLLSARDAGGEGLPRRVYNAGGPERLSRVDMARQVADALGCGHGSILAVPSASSTRNVASPADISMDVGAAGAELGWRPSAFREAVRGIFAGEEGSGGQRHG